MSGTCTALSTNIVERFSIVEMVHGAPEVSYLDFKSRVTPFPAAMLVQVRLCTQLTRSINLI